MILDIWWLFCVTASSAIVIEPLLPGESLRGFTLESLPCASHPLLKFLPSPTPTDTSQIYDNYSGGCHYEACQCIKNYYCSINMHRVDNAKDRLNMFSTISHIFQQIYFHFRISAKYRQSPQDSTFNQNKHVRYIYSLQTYVFCDIKSSGP